MKKSRRFTRWVLMALVVVAAISLAIGCDNPTSSSSSGSPDDNGNGDGNGTTQVKLSGTVSEGDLAGSSLAALDGATEYLIMAVDEQGNTTVAIVESGDDYELDVSRDRNTAIVVFRLPNMELIGILQTESETLGMLRVTEDSTADLNVNSGSISIANSSVAVEDGSEVFTEDDENGIDTTALAAETGTSTEYITLTDFMPRPGTWAITYNRIQFEGDHGFTDDHRLFELSHRDDDGARWTIDFEYGFVEDDVTVTVPDVPAQDFENATSELEVIGPGKTRIRIDAAEGTLLRDPEWRSAVEYPLHVYREQSITRESRNESEDLDVTQVLTVRGIVGTIQAEIDGETISLPVLAVRQQETESQGELSRTQDRTLLFVARYGALSYMLDSDPSWTQIRNFIDQNVRFGSYDPNGGSVDVQVHFAGSGGAIPGDAGNAELRDAWLNYMYQNREAWRDFDEDDDDDDD